MSDDYFFEEKGVHCVVDGQFGSTGKGALTAWLADYSIRHKTVNDFYGSIYSGGPNSGHTFYVGDEKVVLKQLPSFSVYLYLKAKIKLPVYLSAGAIIDRDILRAEANRYPGIPIFVHPNAAIVTDEDREEESKGSIAAVAGTRSGTGAALIRKIRREPTAIAGHSLGRIAPNVVIQNHRIKPEDGAYFMEVSQGFSLGINSEFYPKVTSRECTVMQGLADARIAPSKLAKTYMAIRTYPIRVGDVDGHSSGTWYPDQFETNWDKLRVPAELTTVTQRVRRVATFSMQQFYEACYANDPDVVFISHMDYLNAKAQTEFADDLSSARYGMGKEFTLMYGYGPKISDVKPYVLDESQEEMRV